MLLNVGNCKWIGSSCSGSTSITKLWRSNRSCQHRGKFLPIAKEWYMPSGNPWMWSFVFSRLVLRQTQWTASLTTWPKHSLWCGSSTSVMIWALPICWRQPWFRSFILPLAAEMRQKVGVKVGSIGRSIWDHLFLRTSPVAEPTN